MKLSLGCGDRKKEGYCKVDLCGEPDVRRDLSMFPRPLGEGAAEEILIGHSLGHVDDFEKTMPGIRRILKLEGTLHFKVPHFRSVFTPRHLHFPPFGNTQAGASEEAEMGLKEDIGVF